MPVYKVEFSVKLDDNDEWWQKDRLRDLEEELKAAVYFLPGLQLKTGIRLTRTQSFGSRGKVTKVDA